ncbi:MAG: ABC transporter ATP-binding protein/permease [Thermomicrobiales bacterium]|nr:ABC transporter ATP-binding protein/permease [Thermomicrobiales bacterium]
MSSGSNSLVAIQPLLGESKRSLLSRVRSFIWLIGKLAETIPLPFICWLGMNILQGSMPPFQIWASGKLVNAIQVRIDGHQANPWLWAILMASGLAGSRLLAPTKSWCEAAIHEQGVPAVHSRVLERTTEVDLALLEYQAFHDVALRIAEQANQTLKETLKTLGDILTNVIPIIGAILIISRIHWLLVAALFLPLIPLLAVSLRQGDLVWSALSKQTRDRRIAQYIAARFSDRQAAKEIRLFGLADELIQRWEVHFTATRKEMRGKITRAFLRLQLGGTGADVISYAVLIWAITGKFVYLTAADITVLMGAFMTIGNQSFQLQQATLDIGRHGGFAADVRAFLNLPAPCAVIPTSATIPPQPLSITLDHVSFAYPGATANVIDDVNLTIPVGQTLAIVGENGAGKTTLLKLILGLYQPDSGRILFGDRDLQSIPIVERQALMAAVFQSFSRYPESILENITIPKGHDAAELERVISEAGLDRMIADVPDGIETILSPDLGGIDLSGGQWQRLAIARAAYRNATILALDEPTAALDPLAEVDIFKRFAQLSDNRTTILISHRLGMTRLADRIIVIEHGKITEDGTHAQLLRNNHHYAELWEMQSRWYR